MSGLPGRRHRTLAPSSMVREADIAGIETAIDDITHGVHGEWKAQVPHAGAHSPGAGWSPFPNGSYWISSAAGDVLWVPFPLWDGDALRTLEVVIRAASDPVLIELVEIDLASQTSTVVATNGDATAAATYVKRSFNFVSSQRPRGLRIRDGISHRIRLTAGDTGDRFLGAVVNTSHPRA